MPRTMVSPVLCPRARWASVTSERVPPSPLLSARRTRTTYLRVTMMISAHRIRETTPDHHLAGQGAGPAGPSRQRGSP